MVLEISCGQVELYCTALGCSSAASSPVLSKQCVVCDCSANWVPLRLDAATSTLKRPSMARIQLEIDILKPRPDRIWIGMGDENCFLQKLSTKMCRVIVPIVGTLVIRSLYVIFTTLH